MWPSADALPLTAPQRNALRRLVRGRNTTQKMALRAGIVLRCAQGLANHAIGCELGVNRKTVILWRKRFAQSGLDGLCDQTRPGRKPALSAEFVQCILDTTLHEKPRAATHWSTRTLAKHLGVSKMAIQRVWKAHGLQPHRLETFKLSRDKQFVEKLRDVVGLYLNPPEHALVLSVDEKSQIQALDRSQPGTALEKGSCRHHDPRLLLGSISSSAGSAS
jgi:transposase